MIVGVYSDKAGHPDRLLTQMAIGAPANGAWNENAVPEIQVRHAEHLWITVLAPEGAGQVTLRDRGGGVAADGSSETSTSKKLKALPATWATGVRYPDAPLSAFGQ